MEANTYKISILFKKSKKVLLDWFHFASSSGLFVGPQDPKLNQFFQVTTIEKNERGRNVHNVRSYRQIPLLQSTGNRIQAEKGNKNNAYSGAGSYPFSHSQYSYPLRSLLKAKIVQKQNNFHSNDKGGTSKKEHFKHNITREYPVNLTSSIDLSKYGKKLSSSNQANGRPASSLKAAKSDNLTKGKSTNATESSELRKIRYRIPYSSFASFLRFNRFGLPKSSGKRRGYTDKYVRHYTGRLNNNNNNRYGLEDKIVEYVGDQSNRNRVSSSDRVENAPLTERKHIRTFDSSTADDDSLNQRGSSNDDRRRQYSSSAAFSDVNSIGTNENGGSEPELEAKIELYPLKQNLFEYYQNYYRNNAGDSSDSQIGKPSTTKSSSAKVKNQIQNSISGSVPNNQNKKEITGRNWRILKQQQQQRDSPKPTVSNANIARVRTEEKAQQVKSSGKSLTSTTSKRLPLYPLTTRPLGKFVSSFSTSDWKRRLPQTTRPKVSGSVAIVTPRSRSNTPERVITARRRPPADPITRRGYVQQNSTPRSSLNGANPQRRTPAPRKVQNSYQRTTNPVRVTRPQNRRLPEVGKRKPSQSSSNRQQQNQNQRTNFNNAVDTISSRPKQEKTKSKQSRKNNPDIIGDSVKRTPQKLPNTILSPSESSKPQVAQTSAQKADNSKTNPIGNNKNDDAINQNNVFVPNGRGEAIYDAYGDFVGYKQPPISDFSSYSGVSSNTNANNGFNEFSDNKNGADLNFRPATDISTLPFSNSLSYFPQQPNAKKESSNSNNKVDETKENLERPSWPQTTRPVPIIVKKQSLDLDRNDVSGSESDDGSQSPNIYSQPKTGESSQVSSAKKKKPKLRIVKLVKVVEESTTSSSTTSTTESTTPFLVFAKKGRGYRNRRKKKEEGLFSQQQQHMLASDPVMGGRNFLDNNIMMPQYAQQPDPSQNLGQSAARPFIEGRRTDNLAPAQTPQQVHRADPKCPWWLAECRIREGFNELVASGMNTNSNSPISYNSGTQPRSHQLSNPGFPSQPITYYNGNEERRRPLVRRVQPSRLQPTNLLVPLLNDAAGMAPTTQSNTLNKENTLPSPQFNYVSSTYFRPENYAYAQQLNNVRYINRPGSGVMYNPALGSLGYLHSKKSHYSPSGAPGQMRYGPVIDTQRNEENAHLTQDTTNNFANPNKFEGYYSPEGLYSNLENPDGTQILIQTQESEGINGLPSITSTSNSVGYRLQLGHLPSNSNIPTYQSTDAISANTAGVFTNYANSGLQPQPVIYVSTLESVPSSEIYPLYQRSMINSNIPLIDTTSQLNNHPNMAENQYIPSPAIINDPYNQYNNPTNGGNNNGNLVKSSVQSIYNPNTSDLNGKSADLGNGLSTHTSMLDASPGGEPLSYNHYLAQTSGLEINRPISNYGNNQQPFAPYDSNVPYQSPNEIDVDENQSNIVPPIVSTPPIASSVNVAFPETVDEYKNGHAYSSILPSPSYNLAADLISPPYLTQSTYINSMNEISSNPMGPPRPQIATPQIAGQNSNVQQVVSYNMPASVLASARVQQNFLPPIIQNNAIEQNLVAPINTFARVKSLQANCNQDNFDIWIIFTGGLYTGKVSLDDPNCTERIEKQQEVKISFPIHYCGTSGFRNALNPKRMKVVSNVHLQYDDGQHNSTYIVNCQFFNTKAATALTTPLNSTPNSAPIEKNEIQSNNKEDVSSTPQEAKPA